MSGTDSPAPGATLGVEGKQLIADICEVAWTRLPGSEGEAKAQEFLRGKMGEYGADEVETREYKVNARFFFWYPRVSLVFFLVMRACWPDWPRGGCCTVIHQGKWPWWHREVSQRLPGRRSLCFSTMRLMWMNLMRPSLVRRLSNLRPKPWSQKAQALQNGRSNSSGNDSAGSRPDSMI